jgi:hypothetical protein
MNISSNKMMEVATKENMDFLSNQVLGQWNQRADQLDAKCCEARVEYEIGQRAIDSLTTVRQLSRFLDKDLSNKKIYCSWNSGVEEIQAIAAFRFIDPTRSNLEFVLANPDNLEIPTIQSKKMNGAVAIIIKDVFAEVQSGMTIHAQFKPSALSFAEKIGFSNSDEKPETDYLTPMKISAEKAKETAHSIPFTYEKVEETSLEKKFSSYPKVDPKFKEDCVIM